MIPIEVFIPPTVSEAPILIWRGTVLAIPPLNSVFWINPEEKSAPPIVLLVAGVTTNVLENHDVAIHPIRISAVELDPNTMRPKETLVKPVTIN